MSTEDKVEGKKITFPDDLDMDENGIIYFTDASTKWSNENAFLIDFEHENSGRVIQFDMKTKKASVLLDGLYFPNGIQLSKKKDSLVIAEMSNERLLKYYLKGTKKGQLEVLTEFPGTIDNVRASKNGYWVALNKFRNSSNPAIFDRLQKYPLVKKAVVRYMYLLRNILNYMMNYWPNSILKNLEHYLILHNYLDSSHGMVVEVDENGKIMQSLHSPNGKSTFYSEVLEYNGYLYVGSYINSFIIKVKQL